MMFRKAIVLLGAAGLVLLASGTAVAQDWPAAQGPFQRGPGDYLAWYKLLLLWLVFIGWVRTTDWINRDTLEIGDGIDMPSSIWNPIVVFVFLAAFLLTLVIPLFIVGYIILWLAYLAPLMTYILMRNSRVTDEQKVLTPSHLKRWVAGLATGRKGRRKETKGAGEAGPPVKLTGDGGTETENQANLIIARQSPGFITVKELIADAVNRRADRIMLDYTKETVSVRYEIDGVWHAVEPRDRETADVMLAVMKKISALNMEERRAKQEGRFRAKYMESRLACKLISQGTKTGERVLVEMAPDKSPFHSLEDIGMRESMRDQLKEMLGQEAGMVVMSAMPGGGLRTTWNVALSATDRYLRDFLCVEDKAKSLTHVENVELFTFDGSAGETPMTVLRTVMLREPDAIVVPELINGETVDALTGYVLEQNKLVAVSVRAREGVEALLRVLALKGNPEPFSQVVHGVLFQRLVRKLCETCRQAYEPPKQLLQKLGIPGDRVEVLYREFQPPPPGSKKRKGEPEVCPDCSGIGYRGRTAIFELIKVDDALRQELAGQRRLDALRRLARQAGNRSLQEEGILLVARGVTSLNELQRVLKQ